MARREPEIVDVPSWFVSIAWECGCCWKESGLMNGYKELAGISVNEQLAY
jgi:hypothetical protein